MKDLEPVDPDRCQCEITPAWSPWQFGPREPPARCKSPAFWVLTELVPGPDGRCGAMSLCGSCHEVFKAIDSRADTDEVRVEPAHEWKARAAIVVDSLATLNKG